ncbi:MAG: efflux RND transporter permease subunit [Gemmataceae bacterium]|nr:efflux RND transporter permease subunit [Gemmataceae bacterium]
MSLKALVLLTVSSVVALAGAAVFLLFQFGIPTFGKLLPAESARARPVIVVEAVYPGASAEIVADTVAAPIEQQVNGVENLVSMRSRCGSDGTYTLTLTFDSGTDPNMAQMLVQNRIALAQPVLPNEVQRSGIAVRKKSPHAVMIVVLSSPEQRYDTLYLANYADLQLKEEVARAAGVGEVVLAGQHGSGLLVSVDPDRLTACGLSLLELTKAFEEQGLRVAVAPRGPVQGKGAGYVFFVKPMDKLVRPEAVANMIVKTTGTGTTVRLRDLARVEVGTAGDAGDAQWNGKPVVVLGIYPTPSAELKAVGAAVAEKLRELRANLPEGLALEVACDFSADGVGTADYLRLDATLPDLASAERTMQALQRCDKTVRGIDGVQDSLVLFGPPWSRTEHDGCILLRLASTMRKPADRALAIASIRTRLAQDLKEASVRVCDLSGIGGFMRDGYPLEVIAHCPDADSARKLAATLTERLAKNQQLTDVAIGPGAAFQEQWALDVDRAMASTTGVRLDEILSTLQTHLGTAVVNDPKQAGRVLQVKVQGAAVARLDLNELKKLKVRNAQGQMVPLASLVAVRKLMGAVTLERFNNLPAVAITANPAPGVSLADARALCTSLAEEVRRELQLPEPCAVVIIADAK